MFFTVQADEAAASEFRQAAEDGVQVLNSEVTGTGVVVQYSARRWT